MTLCPDSVHIHLPPLTAVLFWRVRAVFAMYGDIVDSKTNKPLFNKRAWKKALKGYYSDPPGIVYQKVKEGWVSEKKQIWYGRN